jgi:hypothetical protein
VGAAVGLTYAVEHASVARFDPVDTDVASGHARDTVLTIVVLAGDGSRPISVRCLTSVDRVSSDVLVVRRDDDLAAIAQRLDCRPAPDA